MVAAVLLTLPDSSGLSFSSFKPSRSSMNTDILGDFIPLMDGDGPRSIPFTAKPRLSDTATGEPILFSTPFLRFADMLGGRIVSAAGGEGNGFALDSFGERSGCSDSPDTLLRRPRS